MTDLVAAAAEIQSRLDNAGFRNCIIGGLALQAWGEVRLTRDVDFSVLVGFEHVKEQISGIFQVVEPRIPNAEEFALENRVLLASFKGIPADIALAGFEYEKRMIDRSVMIDFGSGPVRICSAEDLVIAKTFASRPRDMEDVASIFRRQGSAVDWEIIEAELPGLLEVIGAPERMEWLRSLR